jgi:hypothetical protein
MHCETCHGALVVGLSSCKQGAAINGCLPVVDTPPRLLLPSCKLLSVLTGRGTHCNLQTSLPPSHRSPFDYVYMLPGSSCKRSWKKLRDWLLRGQVGLLPL